MDGLMVDLLLQSVWFEWMESKYRFWSALVLAVLWLRLRWSR